MLHWVAVCSIFAGDKIHLLFSSFFFFDSVLVKGKDTQSSKLARMQAASSQTQSNDSWVQQLVRQAKIPKNNRWIMPNGPASILPFYTLLHFARHHFHDVAASLGNPCFHLQWTGFSGMPNGRRRWGTQKAWCFLGWVFDNEPKNSSCYPEIPSRFPKWPDSCPCDLLVTRIGRAWWSQVQVHAELTYCIVFQVVMVVGFRLDVLRPASLRTKAWENDFKSPWFFCNTWWIYCIHGHCFWCSAVTLRGLGNPRQNEFFFWRGFEMTSIELTNLTSALQLWTGQEVFASVKGGRGSLGL